MARAPWCFSDALATVTECPKIVQRPKDAKAAVSLRVLRFRRMRQTVNSRLPLGSFPSMATQTVTTVKQLPSILSFRKLSSGNLPSRNLRSPEFVQSMTNIRLGTGRGFRYAYSQRFLRQYTREDAFVEAGSTPRLAVSATGEMEWAI